MEEDLRSSGAGLRGFKSHPRHQCPAFSPQWTPSWQSVSELMPSRRRIASFKAFSDTLERFKPKSFAFIDISESI
jgi:hypothetical protein